MKILLLLLALSSCAMPVAAQQLLPTLFYIKGGIGGGTSLQFSNTPVSFPGGFQFVFSPGFSAGGKLKIGSPYRPLTIVGQIHYSQSDLALTLNRDTTGLNLSPDRAASIREDIAKGRKQGVLATAAGIEYTVLTTDALQLYGSADIALNTFFTYYGKDRIWTQSVRYGFGAGVGTEVKLSSVISLDLETKYRFDNAIPFPNYRGEQGLHRLQLWAQVVFAFFTIP